VVIERRFDRPVVRQRERTGETGNQPRGARRQDQICPEELGETYFDWMENIQPWCISRQPWWATDSGLVRT
jgi:valyl-tRNA synthetase